MLRLDLCRGSVAELGMQALVVEPVDPFQGGEFDFLHGPPRLAGLDEFGFEEPEHGLGQRVVVGVTDRPGRELDAEFAEA